jgi:ketosteroid isomerase-like protein
VAAREIVEGALTAVLGRDQVGMDRYIAPDFVWHVPGRGVISGDVIGPRAWADKLHRLFAAGLQPQIGAWLEEDGARVAALQRNMANVGQHSLDVQVVNLFTIADGKVVRLDSFFDDQYALDAFWDSVLPGGP